MYRDITQWSGIRDRVLRKGVSIRQVARETGISPETIRKMVDHPLPLPYLPRSRSYPKLGPPVGRSGSRRWKTRRGTRTTPRYSPISTPNSTAWRSALQRAFSGNPSYGFFRGNLQNVRSLPMTRFAADSPLEGDGFEPSVPVARDAGLYCGR